MTVLVTAVLDGYFREWRAMTNNVELAGQIAVVVSVLAAVVLGILVRRRNKEQGVVPPPPMFERAERPLPGWKWDGARWRRG